ncbi:dTMP kinase [Helcobacillus massiliensis]|uniref:Thymidylate kinase n=1 Tax=Helcobacillus massiliensis TaxID=521392 RepID=A0A839QWN1_9MICO|nr:dTMP kinase [Helcobacillus massiliensis]MBB3023200.1 dTMP kinase [Helcobacillus massiliensis]MCT1556624.1 dTMP kinase [Helcobacillus massiliensis]MCT2035818.1 dTMP kinase [Helcobacillus massiliensis]MCT2331100.1 dTMP kinase [Helcobacillus massiliensis]MDK7742020.1 dTMP kinase [Helcobacillus massiliensis]
MLSLTPPAARTAESGLFISLEGGDGGGKTTQMPRVHEFLSGPESPFVGFSSGADGSRPGGAPTGPPVLRTKEPGGSALGAELRSLILHSDHVADRAEALMYAADRAHHVETVIRPHLDAGGIVLTDRYLDSSVAYQGAGRTLPVEDVESLSMWAVGGLMPNLTLLLDIAPQKLAERRDVGTHDRLEREALDFHERVRSAYLERAAKEPDRWAVIDAGAGIDEVTEQLRDAITGWARTHAAVVAEKLGQL